MHVSPPCINKVLSIQSFQTWFLLADSTLGCRKDSPSFDGCQRYARQDHVPAQELRTIPITSPFAVWGLDMVGPFSKSPCHKTHLLVAVDKFTKWVEVELVSRVDAASAVRFIKKIATDRKSVV